MDTKKFRLEDIVQFPMMARAFAGKITPAYNVLLGEDKTIDQVCVILEKLFNDIMEFHATESYSGVAGNNGFYVRLGSDEKEDDGYYSIVLGIQYEAIMTGDKLEEMTADMFDMLALVNKGFSPSEAAALINTLYK